MEDNKAKETGAEVSTNADGVGANAGTDTETNRGTQAGTNGDAVNENAFENSSDTGADDAKAGTKDARTQSKEQNAEHARRRREAERQKELLETRNKTIIETLKGKNPYTGESMTDSADVEEYLMMREIEEGGGDPVSDYSKHRKQKERDAARASEEAAKKEEWYQKDLASFVTAYPDVMLDELLADEDFRDYADGKVGNKSMTDIYAGYLKYTNRRDEKARQIAAQMIANRNASPGSLGSTQAAESDFFTPEQVRKMSEAEVHKNYEKIQSSMKKWK